MQLLTDLFQTDSSEYVTVSEEEIEISDDNSTPDEVPELGMLCFISAQDFIQLPDNVMSRIVALPVTDITVPKANWDDGDSVPLNGNEHGLNCYSTKPYESEHVPLNGLSGYSGTPVNALSGPTNKLYDSDGMPPNAKDHGLYGSSPKLYESDGASSNSLSGPRITRHESGGTPPNSICGPGTRPYKSNSAPSNSINGSYTKPNESDCEPQNSFSGTKPYQSEDALLNGLSGSGTNSCESDTSSPDTIFLSAGDDVTDVDEDEDNDIRDFAEFGGKVLFEIHRAQFYPCADMQDAQTGTEDEPVVNSLTYLNEVDMEEAENSTNTEAVVKSPSTHSSIGVGSLPSFDNGSAGDSGDAMDTSKNIEADTCNGNYTYITPVVKSSIPFNKIDMEETICADIAPEDVNSSYCISYDKPVVKSFPALNNASIQEQISAGIVQYAKSSDCGSFTQLDKVRIQEASNGAVRKPDTKISKSGNCTPSLPVINTVDIWEGRISADIARDAKSSGSGTKADGDPAIKISDENKTLSLSVFNKDDVQEGRISAEIVQVEKSSDSSNYTYISPDCWELKDDLSPQSVCNSDKDKTENIDDSTAFDTVRNPTDTMLSGRLLSLECSENGTGLEPSVTVHSPIHAVLNGGSPDEECSGNGIGLEPSVAKAVPTVCSPSDTALTGGSFSLCVDKECSGNSTGLEPSVTVHSQTETAIDGGSLNEEHSGYGDTGLEPSVAKAFSELINLERGHGNLVRLHSLSFDSVMSSDNTSHLSLFSPEPHSNSNSSCSDNEDSLGSELMVGDLNGNDSGVDSAECSFSEPLTGSGTEVNSMPNPSTDTGTRVFQVNLPLTEHKLRQLSEKNFSESTTVPSAEVRSPQVPSTGILKPNMSSFAHKRIQLSEQSSSDSVTELGRVEQSPQSTSMFQPQAPMNAHTNEQKLLSAQCSPLRDSGQGAQSLLDTCTRTGRFKPFNMHGDEQKRLSRQSSSESMTGSGQEGPTPHSTSTGMFPPLNVHRDEHRRLPDQTITISTRTLNAIACKFNVTLPKLQICQVKALSTEQYREPVRDIPSEVEDEETDSDIGGISDVSLDSDYQDDNGAIGKGLDHDIIVIETDERNYGKSANQGGARQNSNDTILKAHEDIETRDDVIAVNSECYDGKGAFEGIGGVKKNYNSAERKGHGSVGGIRGVHVTSKNRYSSTSDVFDQSKSDKNFRSDGGVPNADIFNENSNRDKEDLSGVPDVDILHKNSSRGVLGLSGVLRTGYRERLNSTLSDVEMGGGSVSDTDLSETDDCDTDMEIAAVDISGASTDCSSSDEADFIQIE